ncbi:MAG: hypothetical protein RLZZ385_1808 [Pseudomonadota bacterium]|jgi:putative intracellular protease/amidase/methionine-rich copper-binding protein CopC
MCIVAAVLRRSWLWMCLIGVLVLPGLSLAQPLQVDFSMAMNGLNFDPLTLDANGRDGAMGNGMPDAAEMALISAVLADPALDLSTHGGIRHDDVRDAFTQALSTADKDLSALLSAWPTSPTVAAGYALLGETAFTMYNNMSAGFGAPLEGDYSLALAVGAQLAAEGDADGDGANNLTEYLAFGTSDTDAYVAAALNPAVVPVAGSAAAPPSPAAVRRKNLGIVLYPGFEVLDVYGPLEMWAYVPDFNVILIAEEVGPVMSAQGVATVATHSFDTAPPLDIVMVPGGTGSRVQLQNPRLLNYLLATNETTEYTTSVCTGSALLAKAGILNGQRATTNKRFFFLSEENGREVDWVVDARWVESGKFFTSSGVSAGTDMALGLIAKVHGIEAARELASSLEYTWHEAANVDPFAEYVNRLKPEESGPAAFLRAEPAPASSVNAPGWLRLYFNRLPQVEQSEVRLFAQAPESPEIPLRGMHTMGANDLMLEITQPLTAGTYVVKWQITTAADSESINGEYYFEVAH